MRILQGSIFTYLAIAALSTLTFNQQAAQALPEVHRFICSSGTSVFFQDQNNARLGFGRTPWFLRCITPDFAGSTVGLDIIGDFRSTFESINVVFQDDGSTLPNVTARFCFRTPNGKIIISAEQPFSNFSISKIPNTPYSEGFLSKSAFADPTVKRGSAILTRVTMLVKSGGKQHTITFGPTSVDTSVSNVDPKDIVMDDEGCVGTEPCAPAIFSLPPGPGHHPH